MPRIPLPAEVARLLNDAGIHQQRLVDAGIGSQTARKLLGKAPGVVSAEVIDRALSLLKPPRRLWHAKA